MADKLTTLAAVKEWLGLSTDDADMELARLIEAGSAYAYSYINRSSFAAHDVIENVRGNGKDTMLLRDWPVLSITSLGVEGKPIDPATIAPLGFASNGYRVTDANTGSPQSVDLYGSTFWYRSQVQVSYRAGYEATEDYVIEKTANEADPPVDIVVPIHPGTAGCWLVSFEVKVDDVEATLVTADPQAGQYTLDKWGNHTFSMADVGKTATIRFGYAPWDISQAVTELVAESFRYKDRIGVKSKSLAGQETVSYFDSVMTPTVSMVLGLYKNVVPM